MDLTCHQLVNIKLTQVRIATFLSLVLKIREQKRKSKCWHFSPHSLTSWLMSHGIIALKEKCCFTILTSDFNHAFQTSYNHIICHYFMQQFMNVSWNKKVCYKCIIPLVTFPPAYWRISCVQSHQNDEHVGSYLFLIWCEVGINLRNARMPLKFCTFQYIWCTSFTSLFHSLNIFKWISFIITEFPAQGT